MSSSYQITNKEGLYFLTLQIVGWVDLFSRKIYRDIAIENLKYCQNNKGLEIYAYVFMSNHIHLMVRSSIGDLSGTIRDFKSFSAKKFLEAMYSNTESRRSWLKIVFEYHGNTRQGQKYQIWARGNHAEYIFSQKFIEQKTNYIHQNPVRAGIVEYAENYLYSSARNYAGLPGPIDVLLFDLNWKTY